MPFRMRKVPNKNCYTVYKRKTPKNKSGRRVFAKCSTKKNAESQLRLLRAIEFGKNFVPRSAAARKTAKNRA